MTSLGSALKRQETNDLLLQQAGLPVTPEDYSSYQTRKVESFFGQYSVVAFQADQYIGLKGRVENLGSEIARLSKEVSSIENGLKEQEYAIDPDYKTDVTPDAKKRLAELRHSTFERCSEIYDRIIGLKQEYNSHIKQMGPLKQELEEFDSCIDDSGISMFENTSAMFSGLKEVKKIIEDKKIPVTPDQTRVLETLSKLEGQSEILELHGEEASAYLMHQEGLLTHDESKEKGVMARFRSLFSAKKVQFQEGLPSVFIYPQHAATHGKKAPIAHDFQWRPSRNKSLTKEEIREKNVLSAQTGVVSETGDGEGAHVAAVDFHRSLSGGDRGAGAAES